MKYSKGELKADPPRMPEDMAKALWNQAYRFALSICRRETLADEIAGDAMHKVLRAWQRQVWQGDPRKYMNRVTRNAVLDSWSSHMAYRSKNLTSLDDAHHVLVNPWGSIDL